MAAIDELATGRSVHGWRVFLLGGILGAVAGIISSDRVKKAGKRVVALSTDEYVKLKWSQMTNKVSTTAEQTKGKLQGGIQKVSTSAGHALNKLEHSAQKLEEGVHKLSTTAGQAREKLQQHVPSVSSLVGTSDESEEEHEKENLRSKKKHKEAS